MNQERNSYLEKNYYSKVNVRVPRYIKVKFRPQILLKSYKKLLSSGYSESKNRFYILWKDLTISKQGSFHQMCTPNKIRKTFVWNGKSPKLLFKKLLTKFYECLIKSFLSGHVIIDKFLVLDFLMSLSIIIFLCFTRFFAVPFTVLFHKGHQFLSFWVIILYYSCYILIS